MELGRLASTVPVRRVVVDRRRAGPTRECRRVRSHSRRAGSGIRSGAGGAPAAHRRGAAVQREVSVGAEPGRGGGPPGAGSPCSVPVAETACRLRVRRSRSSPPRGARAVGPGISPSRARRNRNGRRRRRARPRATAGTRGRRCRRGGRRTCRIPRPPESNSVLALAKSRLAMHSPHPASQPAMESWSSFAVIVIASGSARGAAIRFRRIGGGVRHSGPRCRAVESPFVPAAVTVSDPEPGSNARLPGRAGPGMVGASRAAGTRQRVALDHEPMARSRRGESLRASSGMTDDAGRDRAASCASGECALGRGHAHGIFAGSGVPPGSGASYGGTCP